MSTDASDAKRTDPRFLATVQQEDARLRREYPTPEDIPGCISLLDTFLLCNVMNSQFKSLWRYGHGADCARKSDEFKACMAQKGAHPEERRDAWIARRAEWWAARRLDRSSEDVWELRTEPLADYPPKDFGRTPTEFVE